MRKILFSAAMLCGLTSYSQVAQTKQQQFVSPQTVEKCSQHHHMQEMQIKDPARYASIFKDPLPNQSTKHKPNNDSEKLTGVIYTIPVVFHIIHNNGSENISDAQIQDALNVLNRDYRKLNADTSDIVSAFQGDAADVEMRFVFATVAPNGACFSGITRTVSALTNDGSDGEAQVAAVVSGNNVYQGIWPHNRYLNIYIANDIGGAAGYTFNPNNGGTAQQQMYYNGVFALHNYTGSIGTSNVNNSRTLTHEVGHWLNLSHVWGANNNPGSAGCGGTDNVNDTPATQGSTSCNYTQNSCTTDNAYWGFNQIDQVQNYMDYSYCSVMFTQGQVDRMRAAIISSVGGRNNIWTTANLNLVGGGPGTSLCALDFNVNQPTVCAGTTVTYTPSQTTGIATYSWSFPGGTPSTSTLASPTVTYPTVGTYNASLTVTATSNGASYSKSKTNYITVNSATTVSLPINEGFVSTTFPPTGWTIVDPGATTGSWTRSSTVGRAPTAGNSLRFDNYNLVSGTDEMRLPKADIAAYSSATLTFDVAYAPYSAAYYDGLQVLVSTDCGNTFTTVYSKSNTTLATASATTASFVPSAAQWRAESIDLTPYVGNSSVWISFKNNGGNGNNIYIDNINVSGVAGTPTAPVASFTSTNQTICAGQSVTYTSTSSNNPTSYSWSFPGGTPSSSTSASQVVTYPTAGTYNVTLTATNAGGSNASNQTGYVTVNAVPAAPTITAGGTTTFCQGGSVTLTSSAGSATTWSNSASGSSITVNASGTYTATTTVASCPSVASNTVTVTVNPNPSVSFSGVPMLCVNDGIYTFIQGSPAGGTYSGTGVTGNQFNPATVGVSSTPVTYSYTNGNGCSGSAQTTVVVDGCASISENELDFILVYPNPSTGSFTISSGEVNMNSVKVYNALGQVVYEVSGLQTSKQDVDLKNMAKGVYTLRVLTDAGTQHIPVVLEK